MLDAYKGVEFKGYTLDVWVNRLGKGLAALLAFIVLLQEIIVIIMGSGLLTDDLKAAVLSFSLMLACVAEILNKVLEKKP